MKTIEVRQTISKCECLSKLAIRKDKKWRSRRAQFPILRGSMRMKVSNFSRHRTSAVVLAVVILVQVDGRITQSVASDPT